MLASTSTLTLVVLLTASAALAAPAAQDAGQEDAVGDKQEQAASHAPMYDAGEDSGTRKGRDKKQTTRICIEVAPAHGGQPAQIMCGDTDRVLDQQRQLLQTPVVTFQSQAAPQAAPQAALQAAPLSMPGYYGSPNTVNIVPAPVSYSDSVVVGANPSPGSGPSSGLTDTVVISPAAFSPTTHGYITVTTPFRNADGGLSNAKDAGAQGKAREAWLVRANENTASAVAPTSAPFAAPATAAAQELRGIFSGAQPTAPSLTAATPQGQSLQATPATATPASPAHQSQGRSFGEEQIIVSQQPGLPGSYGPYGSSGVGGSAQSVTLIKQNPYGHSSSQVDIINEASVPGTYPQYPMGVPGPALIGGVNYRAAELTEAAANGPASGPANGQLQQQQQQQQNADSQQARTASAVLLQAPVVLRKDVVIPAVGSSSLSVSAPVSGAAGLRVPTLTELLNPVSPLSGLGHLSVLPSAPPLPQVQRVGSNGASIPVMLNCDLSTLSYTGAPQQLQLKLAPVPVAAPGAGSARAAAEDEQLKDVLSSAVAAAANNRTVTVNLGGQTGGQASGQASQPGELSILESSLHQVQQREQDLLQAISTLKATGSGHQDNDHTIKGLQQTADQLSKARAAMEEAVKQAGGGSSASGSASGSARAAESMSAAQLEQLMRSSSGSSSSGAQFRYFPDSSPMASSVVVGMSPSAHSPGILPYPGRQQTTTVVSSSSSSNNNFGLEGFHGRPHQPPVGVSVSTFGQPGGHMSWRSSEPQQQPQPQPQPQAQQQPQPQPQSSSTSRASASQWSQYNQQPLIQPAQPGAEMSTTQQKLLQKLREAQDDYEAMKAASLQREDTGRPRQAATPPASPSPSPSASSTNSADEFPPTPGYEYIRGSGGSRDASSSSTAWPSASFSANLGSGSGSGSGAADRSGMSVNANMGPMSLRAAASGPQLLLAPQSPAPALDTRSRRYW